MKKLNKLKQKKHFTSCEARNLGISRRMLKYYTDKKLVTRLGQGVYIFTEMQGADFESLVKEVIIQIPMSVVCLETALIFHNLTEEAPPNIQIMVPKTNVPKRKLHDVKLYRINPNLLNIGIIRKNNIKITGIERTIIDLLKFDFPLSKIINIFNEAKGKRKSINFSELKKMATMFRVKAKFEKIMEAIL